MQSSVRYNPKLYISTNIIKLPVSIAAKAFDFY